MRVSTIQAQDQGENVFLDYRYFYDKAGNITAKESEHGRYDYGYDDLYRLTASDNPVQADEAYSYDAVGNRLTAEDVAGNWSYNDNNELQAYAGVNYEYDNNGNLIKKTDAGQITNYIYNVEDRLDRVVDGSGSLISSYYYDPFGRRLWKVSTKGSRLHSSLPVKNEDATLCLFFSKFPGIRETSMEVSRLISPAGSEVINENNLLGDHGYAPVYLYYLKMRVEELKRN